MPSERRLLRARPLGSVLLGPGDEHGSKLRVRVQVLITVANVIANAIGVALVAVLLLLVLPGDPVLTRELALLNFVAVPVYAATAFVVASWWETVVAVRSVRWSIEDRAADEHDRVATLRLPWVLTSITGLFWLVGAVAFTLAYGLSNDDLVAKVGFTSVLAGVVVCGNSYLLNEFTLRPVAARALTDAPPPRGLGIGLTFRALVIGALGAVPMFGLMAVSLFALIRGDVTTDRLAIAVLVLGAIGLVFGSFLLVMNTRAMAAPIRTVTSALAKVQDGDLDTEVLVFDGTELGMLQSGFNRMVSDVREREQIRDLFGRHVGEDVARAAMSRQAGLGGEVRDIAVLFIDVVGSTTIATEQPPEDVVKLLNRFFAVVVDEVNDHGGFVNKFEGDAALAIFGAPEELVDAAGCALAAARSIMARLDVDVPDIEAGIGVSAGPAVAGNVGAEDRFEYTVIGDPVNEGARLSETAKTVDGHVVASMRAVEVASRGEAAHWKVLEEVTLRGRTEATTIAVPI